MALNFRMPFCHFFFGYPHLFIFISCRSSLLHSIPLTFLSLKWAKFILTAELSYSLFLLLEFTLPDLCRVSSSLVQMSPRVRCHLLKEVFPSYLSTLVSGCSHFLLFLLSSHHSLIRFYLFIHIFIVYSSELDVHSKRVSLMSYAEIESSACGGR